MKSTIRALLLGAAGSLAIMGAASAADLSRGYAPPMPVWNWSGLYLGINGGWSWNDEPVVVGSAIGLRPSRSGGLFGAHIGYNWQFTPEWVVGVETDASWADLFGSARVGVFGPFGFAPDPFTIAVTERVSALGTLRGRVGYALDNVLLYGTAGLAYGRTELTASVRDNLGCGPAGFCGAADSSKWMVGWAAGAGFDWAFLPRWNLRAEYLHYDLGTMNQNLIDPAVPNSVSVSASFRGEIVRGALSYKLY